MIQSSKLYGKIFKRQILKGTCSGCQGSRNEEAADEAIILCDGKGCCREYHLGCTDPLLYEVPEGEFYCVDCDAEGTTRYLREYFEKVSDEKSEFKTSKEFVESLIQKCLVDESRGDHSKDAAGDDAVKRKRRKVDTSPSTPPFSEISRIEALYHAVMDDSTWKSKGDGYKQKQEEAAAVFEKVKAPIGRDFLIGKICKIYCPSDNQYHTGRIINWRSALEPGIFHQDSNQYFYGEGDIACTEFLIRFPAGTDGRKKTLLQWLILEEHSTAVSSIVVLALKKKGKGFSGWQYGQLMLRSCIELIPVRNIVSKCDYYGLVSFFDLNTNIYLDLMAEAFSMDCKVVQKIRQGSHDSNRELFEGYARVEIMEQERTKRWYSLYLKNPFHKKALTILDEYSWDLDIDDGECDASESLTDAEGYLMPKLCPCIQQGLDKQWIASQIGNVKSFDAVASMKVIKPASADAIALINKTQRNRNMSMLK